jgi:hypothetical protein
MEMPRFFWVALMGVLVIANGCKKQSDTRQKEQISDISLEPRMQPDGPPTVLFDINSVPAPSAGTHLYECIYQARGQTARFRISYKQTSPIAGELPMGSAEGSFLAVSGSESPVLLEDLKKALDAKEFPRNISRIKELPFNAAILGEQQSRDASGGYSNRPKGDWTLLKLFLPKGGDDGEVFLNINPVIGKAEFSIKDSDYGNYLLEQLAKVL